MKTGSSKCIILGVLVTMVLATGAFSADTHTCAVCGMTADEAAPFTAKIDGRNQVSFFCDIGDLLVYVKDKAAVRSVAYVKDYPSRKWIKAAKAFYVKAPQRFTTPMGWSIAAFQDRKLAAEYGTPSDLESAITNLK